MSAKHHGAALIDQMPSVHGRLEANAPLAKYTWFKAGGEAEVLFRPADQDDLSAFLAGVSNDVPLTVIGNASNLLVRDGGIPGVVIRLGSGFSNIGISGTDIIAGSGAADLSVARKARDAGLAGLEFLSGIPGTIGGSVIMNAGAYGFEIKDVCTSVRAVDREGAAHEIASDEMGFTYRHSDMPTGMIVTSACFQGIPGEIAEISNRMETIQNEREVTQPVRTLTGGSTFQNPPGYKAWELVDQAGCRGLRRGGAMVSELHCNFLINTGGATATDLEGLGEEVRRRVFEKSGISLEWEIKRIGSLGDKDVKEIGR